MFGTCKDPTSDLIFFGPKDHAQPIEAGLVCSWSRHIRTSCPTLTWTYQLEYQVVFILREPVSPVRMPKQKKRCGPPWDPTSER